MKKTIAFLLITLSILFNCTTALAGEIGTETEIIPQYHPCPLYSDGHHPVYTGSYIEDDYYYHNHYIDGVKFNCRVDVEIQKIYMNVPVDIHMRERKLSQKSIL